MFERHIEEPSTQRTDRLIEALIESLARYLSRRLVAGIARTLAPEHVSGELIEEQNQSQGAFGSMRQGVKLAGDGALVGFEEERPYFRIKCRVFQPPRLA